MIKIDLKNYYFREMFWRLNCFATILLTLSCTSNTFWIGLAEHQPHHGDHKLSDQEHYKVNLLGI